MPYKIENAVLTQMSVTQLADFIEKCLDIIKENRLLEDHYGEEYSQGKLAERFNITRPSDLSNAKQLHAPISIKKRRTIAQLLLDKFPSIVLTEEGEAKLSTDSDLLVRELAGKLALNLIDVSTEFDTKHLPYAEMLVRKETYANRLDGKDPKRERFIAVIGAGASKAATIKSGQYVLDADEAISHLRKVYIDQVEEKMLIEKTKQIADRMRTSPDNFEAQLLAMAQFSTSLVTEELTKLCGNKNVPCLVYEILAHMFKHRFIDVIVNFNYDELLDNAISEELPNPGDYQFIYTSGHCPRKLRELQIDNRIKQPIYIKCHGTISQPNSLRFMEARAFMMEPAIQDHLLELLEGNVPNAVSQDYLPINLLVFGFSMQNHMFNKLIERSLEENPEKLTIWLFDTNLHLKEFVKQQFTTQIAAEKIEIKFFHLDTDAKLESVLINLWEKISSNFDEYYRPRNIDRHYFVNHIFEQVSPILLEQKGRTLVKKYYQDRLFVELFILILQSNGIIHLSQVTRSRVGKFLLKLKQEADDKNPIFHYLEEMGMVPYQSFMFDTFVVRDWNTLITKDALIKFLMKKLEDNLKMKESRKALNDKDSFSSYVEGILKRRLLLVNPEYDHVHDNIFAELSPKKIMNTSLAWIYNYRRNITENADQWDVMLAISEEGGFLRKDFKKNRFKGANKFFEVILAATGINERSDGASEWIDKDLLLSGGLKYRPWWLHNKHMVILLKRKDTAYTGDWSKDWKLQEGFYYQHKMLSRRVNPVRITEEKDLVTLIYMFAIYWRGKLDTPILSKHEELDLRVITRQPDIEDAINEILAPYESKRLQSK